MTRFIPRILAAVLATVFAAGFAFAQNSYVNAKTCKPCHSSDKMGGTAYLVWAKTAHANAFKTLKSEAAEKIAKGKGLKKAAAESPECLKCHVTGGGTDAKVIKDDGVSCEACHGAGSGYKTIHVKPENKEKAVAAGLVLGNKDDGKPCETCHNSESPTFKKFVMADMWAKIAHSKPDKKK